MLATNEELAVEKEFKEEIEGVLARIRPSLGGADVELRDVNQRTVTVQHHRPLSKPLWLPYGQGTNNQGDSD